MTITIIIKLLATIEITHCNKYHIIPRDMYRKSLLNKFMRNKHTDSLLQNGSSDKQGISHLVTINGQELASESSEPSYQDNKEALQEFFNNGALNTV